MCSNPCLPSLFFQQAVLIAETTNRHVFLSRAISQPCLYNYTIDGTQTVIVNQSSPVCLICSNTAFDKWFVGSLYPGIAGAPYIFYVESPVATLLSVLQVGCYSLPGQEDIISSTIGVAVPVIPHVVTYVNETDHLTLVSSNVITATPSVIALSGRSWLDPKGSSIRLLASPAGIITGLVPFVNRTAAGNYTCVARLVANANGVTTVTGTTLVVVYYPPTVLSPQPTVYMVQGRTIQLNCTFDGLPTPNVIWTHPNGSVITSQSRFTIQTTSTSSSLTITSLVGGGDTGTYTCSASNFRGVSTNTTQLFVQVPLDPPSNVMVTSVGNSSLSLSWTNGFDGFSPLSNVVISYEVDRYPQEGTQAQTFPMGTSATLVGLHPYSNYTLHVSLTNAVGFISNPTNITTTTLSLRLMAPAITSVVAMSSTQVTIMWTPSINSSTTAPVTSWTVLYSCYSPWNPSSCPSGSITSSSSSSSSITGLKKGSRYTFVVFGVNSGGVGDVSLPATNQTLVDSPTVVVGLTAVVMTTTSVNLIWTPPADNGGQNISHYVIQYGVIDGNYLTNVTTTTTMATQILLSGLTENSWYLFSVAAHNDFAVGDSTLQIKVLLERGDIMSIEEVAIISTVTTFPVAFALGAAAMGVIVHCRSRHLAAAISGDHLTMKANTVYSLQKRNNASGEIGYTGDQEQDTAMERAAQRLALWGILETTVFSNERAMLEAMHGNVSYKSYGLTGGVQMRLTEVVVITTAFRPTTRVGAGEEAKLKVTCTSNIIFYNHCGLDLVILRQVIKMYLEPFFSPVMEEVEEEEEEVVLPGQLLGFHGELHEYSTVHEVTGAVVELLMDGS
eukprot:Em0005g10a